MLDFYEAGARSARHTEKLATSETTVGGRPAQRLDVLGSDGTGQTVVAWPAASAADRVWVLLAADLGDAKVASRPRDVRVALSHGAGARVARP